MEAKKSKHADLETKKSIFLEIGLIEARGLSLLIILLSAATMLIYSQPAFQKVKEKSDTDRTLSPYFFVKSDNPDLDQLPLKATSAVVNIAGVIADVTVIQEYANEGKKPIEAIYIFPASTRAAVYSMKMTIGERTITAKIAEREQARKDYETAKQEGKSASLLEQQRPNVFQMNVANIMPGDKIQVELKYTELLIPEDGVYEFVYPTVVGPRYSNQPAATAPRDDHWVRNPYTHEGEKALYSFNFICRLSAGIPIGEVLCPSHKTDISFTSPSEAAITLKPEEKHGGNRDFILRYRLTGDKIQSGLLLYPGKEENFFLAMIQPPKQVKLTDIPPREYVFIVDVSGSMHGYPLDVSKTLLKDLISNLRPSDRFNVLLFSGAANLMGETSVEANSTNIDKALRFIEREQGGGGTELLSALNKALNLEGCDGFARSFIIATDGYVDVEKRAFDFIRENLDKANFFAFGIGSSVNRHLIEGMAHVGMGMPFVVARPEEAAETAEKFRQYVQNPVLTHIQVRYNKFEAYDVEPLSVPDVFSERPVIIFGKYHGIPSGNISIQGINGNGEYVTRLNINSFNATESNIALRYLWARERIRTLSDYAATSRGGEDENKPAIIRLGLTYNLLTAYTSFVAIDNDIRNKNGNPATVSQPLPLPEGVSEYAVGARNSVSGVMVKDCTVVGYGISRKLEKAYGKEVAEFETPVFMVVEQMPEFIGGEMAMEAFLKSNLKYPQLAKDYNIRGTVYVSFMIDEKGNVSKVKVLRGIGGGCDEEAIRVIELTSGRWRPGTQNGKTVKVMMNLPVNFSSKQ